MQPWQVSENDTKAHEDIHALLHLAFAYMDGRIDPPSSLHRLTVADIAKHAGGQEVWAIGKPIQACVFFTPKEQVFYLGKLAVHPDHRGVGHARTLVNLAAVRARALGYTTLEVITRIELTENHTAFAKLGFHKTAEGRHPGYDCPTEITMQKTVSFEDS